MNELNQFSNSGKIERHQEKESAREIIQILQELNSEKNRHSLDELYRQFVYLDNMRKTNLEKLPPHTHGIIAAAKNLFKALEKIGLKPYGNINEEFELKEDMMDNFQFTGKPIGPEENKNVGIVAPGWKYKEEVISLPKIQKT